MDRISTAQAATMPVEFKLNGRTVVGRSDETLIETAKHYGIGIPHLCYKEGMRPDGNCRACVVEIKGERVLAPSCCRYPKDGMEVTTDNPRSVASQKMVLELLLSDIPEKSYTLDSELDHWAKELKVGKPRFESRHQPKPDLSHAAIAVNLDACIQCTRCLRACREEQVNDVIGYAFRGEHSKIVFDFDDPMGESTCVACGECVQACPTGALMPAREVGKIQADKTVDSVCPYCGVGCLLTYNVKGNKILWVQGREGPANSNRLCVKGRYGFDYVQHKHRLTKPLVRKPGVKKHKDFIVDPDDWSQVFREASWEEALTFAAKGLRDIRDRHGKKSLAGFGSAKGTNEEAYLFQKLVRTGFGSNNVDHCTRLCHASSVAALMEGINSGAVSNQVRDVMKAEVIFLIGANPTVNHPVAATWMKNAAKAGVKLIVADPRRGDLARHATYNLQFKADTDVALLNAMLHTIVEEGLVNEAFVRDRTSGYEALAENVKKFSPEAMAPVCGIDAKTIREGALREIGGHGARRETRPHRGRDHARREEKGNPRHVHHGREPGDVRSRRRSRARGARLTRSHGGAGHLPHRDRLPRRRGAAGDGMAGEGRHGHQHRPHGAARKKGDRAAGRGERRPLADQRAGQAHRPSLELHASARSVRRDAPVHGLDRRDHLGAPRARVLGDLPLREGRRSGGTRRVRHAFPHDHGPRQVRSRGPDFGGGAPGRPVPDGPHHRQAAGALAHRRDDAPRLGPRSHRARARRVVPSSRPRSIRGEGGRDRDRGIAPRKNFAVRPRRRRHTGGRGVHTVLLLRGGGEHAHQPGARPGRENPGVQVLRSEGHQRRADAGALELRRRDAARGRAEVNLEGVVRRDSPRSRGLYLDFRQCSPKRAALIVSRP